MRREPWFQSVAGTITAPADDWDAIRQAVRHHNASTAHREACRRLDKAPGAGLRCDRMTWDLDVLLGSAGGSHGMSGWRYNE